MLQYTESVSLAPPCTETNDVLRQPSGRQVGTVAAAGPPTDERVASWHHCHNAVERRKCHRAAYRRPVVIHPWSVDLQAVEGDPSTAMGRDLSVEGFSFTHFAPMPYRLILVTFLLETAETQSAVLKLNWCRFTREQVYQSGGPFVKRIDSNFTPDLFTRDHPAA